MTYDEWRAGILDRIEREGPIETDTVVIRRWTGEEVNRVEVQFHGA